MGIVKSPVRPDSVAPVDVASRPDDYQGRTGWDVASGLAKSIRDAKRIILLVGACALLVWFFGAVAVLYLALSLVIGTALFMWLLIPNGVIVDVVKPTGEWDTHIVGRDLWQEIHHDGPPQIKLTSPVHTALGRPRFVAEELDLEKKTVRFSWVSGLTLVDYHCDMTAYQKLLDFVHARMDSWLDTLAFPSVMGQAYAGDIIEGFLSDFGKRIKTLDPKYSEKIPYNERVSRNDSSASSDDDQGASR